MNAIKSLRLRAGMQQKEVALAVGVSRPTVSEWEHQKKDPTGERLKKLAKLFNVSTGVVLAMEPIPSGVPETLDSDEARELWELREAVRRDPDRRVLFSLAKNGTAAQVRQMVSLLDAMKATNPEFYDGDDPA
ncbi:MAG: helix-turn-helix domain-containing protein [Clostridia bacterium]|nr:helix-turn-helix domain-containing protein [Clostridia bacterium]